MRILGIDPGTATTGYGLISEAADGRLDVIEYGVISTSPTLNMPDRLALLYHRLNDLILLHQPDGGAVEKLFFQRNVTTAIAVGQARGVVLLAMAEAKLPVGEYTPLEVKLAVAGYGRAGKNQVQQMVQAILNLSELPRPDDAADALAIAICHLHSARYNNADLRGQTEAQC